jgi:hypothetical protein
LSQLIVSVQSDGVAKGTITFTFTTMLPVIARVEVSRKTPVNNAFNPRDIVSRGASPTPLKAHKIKVQGLGNKPREL